MSICSEGMHHVTVESSAVEHKPEDENNSNFPEKKTLRQESTKKGLWTLGP